MRRSAAAAVALPASLILLAPAGCASVDDQWLPWFMRSEGEYPAELPAVAGEFGEEPEVDFGDEEPPEEPLSGIAIPGNESDDLVRSGDVVIADIASYQWSGAGQYEELYSSHEEGAPEEVPLTPELEEIVDCVSDATVGSRVVCVMPAAAQDPAMEADPGASMLVLDLHDHYAQGSLVEAEQTEDGGGDLPEVPEPGAAAPEIGIPDTDPPEDLETVVLAEGEGPELEEGERLVMQYTGVRWDDGEVFDSTWDPGRDGTPVAFPIGAGQLIEGWDEGLIGQNVGSRVMLVVPEDMAYGEDAEEMGQPAGTLVFVVDMLGALEPMPEPEMPEEPAPEDMDLEDMDLEDLEPEEPDEDDEE